MHKQFLLTLLCILSICTWARPKPGEMAPAYLGKDRVGDEYQVADFKGKVLAVTFWASWCGYCLKELPVLEGIQKVAGKDQLRVVAINIEERAEFRVLARKLAAFELLLTHDGNGSISARYGREGIPHLVLIGRDGKVINTHIGYGESTLDSIIEEVNAALQAG